MNNITNAEYDYLFKTIIIGDSGIGKSSILYRFADDVFNEGYISTIGVDFKMTNILIDGRVIRMQIWDTAGQERFKTITTSYYRGSHIIFLCYDITDKESFYNLDRWYTEIRRYANENVKIILCGTKSDLVFKRQVTHEEGKAYAEKYNFEFYETSAKKNINIDEIFEKSSREFLNTFMNNLNNDTHVKKKLSNNTVSIDNNYKDILKTKCC